MTEKIGLGESYVPILLARRGERIALRELPPAIRSGFTPLLEIPHVPMDWNEEEFKGLGEHITGFPVSLNRDLSEYERFFLDVPYLRDPNELVNGYHPVSVLFAACRNHGLKAVPVAARRRGNSHNSAVKDIMQVDGRGACLRLSKADLSSYATVVRTMLRTLNAKPEDIDLMVDLGFVEQSNVLLFARSLRLLLSNLLFSSRPWRSLTLASGAFPSTLSSLPQGITALPRADWELWYHIRTNLQGSARIPNFGDYGIQSPEAVMLFDPRYMSVSANIRYTTPKDWLVSKGQLVLGRQRVGNEAAYRGLCRAIVRRREFRGPAFSPGDRYMNECAAGRQSPGTLEIWRRQGTSHHIATVVDQVASI